jgi:DNA-binding NarL/FixJ family response regulator
MSPIKTVEKVLGIEAEYVAKRLSELTSRESEVADLLANGLSAHQIGERLGISNKTVDIHRGKIKIKLGVKSTVDLARHVLLKKIVDALENVSKDKERRSRNN